MFGVNYEDVTDEQRSEAKRRYHMMVYNASDVQLAMDMEAWRVSHQSRWERFCEWVAGLFDNLFDWLS
jgi:DNA polymerase I-like protein with 3'-5' exonuclease and polymerase domains